LELLIFREIVLILGTAAAAYTDIKTGLINDYITYSMIALGIIFNLIEFDVNAFLIAGAVFVIGFALYFLGQIGGGDVKLFTGIALLLPVLDGITFIASSLFIALLLAIVFNSIYYTVKYFRKGIDFEYNKFGFINSGILAIALIVFFYLLWQMGLSVNFLFLFAVVMLFALLRMALEKGIRKEFFLERVALNKLEEDEIAAVEFMDKDVVNETGLMIKKTIGKEEMEKLKKLKVKEVAVFRNLPKFAPFIFVGVIVVILYPGVLEFILF